MSEYPVRRSRASTVPPSAVENEIATYLNEIAHDLRLIRQALTERGTN